MQYQNLHQCKTDLAPSPPSSAHNEWWQSVIYLLTNCILFELAHAIFSSQKLIVTRNKILQDTLDDETIKSLPSLGDQMFGPRVWLDDANVWRPAAGQFFTEDAAQGEDGVNFGNELWRDRAVRLPAGG